MCSLKIEERRLKFHKARLLNPERKTIYDHAQCAHTHTHTLVLAVTTENKLMTAKLV